MEVVYKFIYLHCIKNKQTMKKTEKLKLEIMAIQLWIESFGMAGMSDEKQRVYMSSKLKKLKMDLNNAEYFSLIKHSNIRLIK